MKDEYYLHLFASIIISMLVYKYTGSRKLAIIVSILVGFLKEVYDLTIKKTYISTDDIFFDLLGAIIGGIL